MGSIFEKYNVSLHCFADDVQIYMLLTRKSKGSLQLLLDNLRDIITCMKLNFLDFRGNKTELIVFGHPDLFNKGTLGTLGSHMQFSVKSLGVCNECLYI